MTRDIGTEYAITATIGDLPTITIPVGDEGNGCTLVNDSSDSIYWREISNPPLTPVGNAATLIAAPFFMSRLRSGEFVHKAGITIQVVCATATTATLRVVPARLYKSLLVNAEVNVPVNLGLLNKDEEEINPATEDKQDDIISRLTSTNDGVSIADYYDSTTKLEPLWASGMGPSIGTSLESIATSTGVTTDDVLAGETLEDSTARTGISLWKRAVNFLIGVRSVLGATDDVAKNGGETGSINARLRSQQEDIALIQSTTGLEPDAAVAAGAAGGISAKLRSISRELGTVAEAATGTGTLTEKVPTWLTVVVTTPGTPEPFAVNDTFATYVSIEAKRANGDNVDDVYIRDNTVDKDSAQGHVLGPGEPWDLTARPGTMFDLNDLKFDAIDTDDGIVIQYQPA